MAREVHVTDPNATYGGLFQVAGLTSANVAQVETNTKALRLTLRDNDALVYGGSYHASGVISSAVFSLSSICLASFVWLAGSGVAVIRKVKVDVGQQSAGAGTAGSDNVKMFRASGYTAANTTGTRTTVSPATTGLLRSAQYEPQGLFYVAATSSGLTGGTETQDTQPMGALIWSHRVGSMAVHPISEFIFDASQSNHPLVLSQNTGFDLVVTSGNPNGWYNFQVGWDEFIFPTTY